MIVATRIPGITRRSVRKLTKARGLKPSRKVQLVINAALRGKLTEMAGELEAMTELILAMPPDKAKREMKLFRAKWSGLFGQQADAIAARWAEAVAEQSRQEFRKSVGQAIGMDIAAVLDGGKVREAAVMAANEASKLIRTIPEDYLNEVEKAAWVHYQQLPQPEGRTLLEQIQHIGGVSKNRAKLIARDQTSKIHTAVNQARNEEAGIEEYIWRTARDGRVVGNPAGLYPEVSNKTVHGNHYAREGKKFRWDRPPEDGHPGTGINCRCIPEPVIDMTNLQIAFG